MSIMPAYLTSLLKSALVYSSVSLLPMANVFSTNKINKKEKINLYSFSTKRQFIQGFYGKIRLFPFNNLVFYSLILLRIRESPLQNYLNVFMCISGV